MADWALILGASSGFGEATSLALAKSGFNILGVHLDRRATLPNVQRIVQGIEALGRRAEFFNVNAADAEKRQPGRILDVELEDDDEYEIRILRADGVVVELEYEARSGKLIELEIEGDD